MGNLMNPKKFLGEEKKISCMEWFAAVNMQSAIKATKEKVVKIFNTKICAQVQNGRHYASATC